MGVRNILLAYVIRAEPIFQPIGPQMADAPHSQEYLSIEKELIAQVSHEHPFFQKDKAKVYYKLKEATRSKQYAASIKPFTRLKNGREAWLALCSQYAGNNKLEAKIKAQENLLHTRI